MEYSRFLDCLAADFARLRAVVPTDPTAAVPSCPGWTVTDLTRHVGEVYLHKTLAMREGAEPDPWPPKELAHSAGSVAFSNMCAIYCVCREWCLSGQIIADGSRRDMALRPLDPRCAPGK